MIKIGGFKNPKNWFENQTQSCIQNKEKNKKLGLKVPLEIKI
jgi:hypothetical protein